MTKIKDFYNALFLHRRFYIVWAVITFIIFLGYWWTAFWVAGKYLFFIFIILTLLDFFYLFKAGQVVAERFLPEKLSNGDDNIIKIEVANRYPTPVHISIIDELPAQLQKRDFGLKLSLSSGEKRLQKYAVRPVKRGEYTFGKLNIFVYSPLQLAGRRSQFSQNKTVKVFPSFLQMRRYELIAFSNKSRLGIKKVRRLGHTLEFEQIKAYSKGDDYRTINWKATAKHQKLMVNQYQDEKSQNIYSIIDMGRQMALPFKEMTLLDYAINSSLAFSNIAMKKKDKAGLLSFERRINSFIKPDNGRHQLYKIFESLYAQETRFSEADYERLYQHIRQKIPTRSLLMLYTNFEHINSLKRQLPYLKKIARKHLLVIVFFKNTELTQLLEKPVTNTQELYHKIVATDFDWQKRMMVKTLQLHNIHTVLTEPEHLTSATINKYLQLKARGLI